MDPDAPPLLEYLDPIPDWLGAYRLEEMRFYSHKTTVLPANWKVVIDAFNEGYHVQGTHPQILAWTDDVSMEYEQFDTHAHYGRLPSARRQLRPSPRLGLARRRRRRVGDPRRPRRRPGRSRSTSRSAQLVEELRTPRSRRAAPCSRSTSSGGESSSHRGGSTSSA